MTFQTRDEALDALKIARADWLVEARAAAYSLALSRQGQTCCSDDIWQLCPPPPEADPRCMGPLFLEQHWQKAYMRPSMRPECHKRPIQVWRLVEEE